MIRVRHIGITVTDFDRMLDFYRRLLGFSRAKIAVERGEYIDNFSGLSNVKVQTAKLSNESDEVLIELLKYHSHKSFVNRNMINECGISHFALTVDNLDDLFLKLSNEGIEFMAEPQRPPGGKVSVTFCRDPENNLIELVEEL